MILRGVCMNLESDVYVPCVLVTLCPVLERLACSAYLEVATQLPLMLRQWHLKLDRQTSAMVSK